MFRNQRRVHHRPRPLKKTLPRPPSSFSSEESGASHHADAAKAFPRRLGSVKVYWLTALAISILSQLLMELTDCDSKAQLAHSVFARNRAATPPQNGASMRQG